METHAYGLPILTTKTLDGWLEEEGLVWPDIRPPVPLNDWVGEYARPASDVGVAKRFAPKVKVLEQRRPDGTIFPHFIIDEGQGVLVFCRLPNPVGEEGLVVLIAEPKSWGVSVMPPGGVLKRGETPEECAFREFAEETGIMLSLVQQLAGARATPYHRRLGGRGEGTYWFRGFVGDPIQVTPQKDNSEQARAFLMPLSEWRALCHEGGSKHGVVEACGPAITLDALHT